MTTYSGYVTIVGRPNVGKSTLLNTILEQKISITSSKAQTTRNCILGIKTVKDIQAIYIDTPGLQIKKHQKALNRYLYQTALSSLQGVDVIVFLVEALKWLEEDDLVIRILQRLSTPIILAINKVDCVKPKDQLLPYLNNVAHKSNFTAIIPLSAKNKDNVSKLETVVASLLPAAPFVFPAEQITDKSERFLVSEIIREKLTRFLGQEIPHELFVEIEFFKEEAKLIKIAAIIYVERIGQKAIVIGEDGSRLKLIGTRARLDIERLLNKKIFLQLWVKVKPGWSDNKHILKSLG